MRYIGKTSSEHVSDIQEWDPKNEGCTLLRSESYNNVVPVNQPDRADVEFSQPPCIGYNTWSMISAGDCREAMVLFHCPRILVAKKNVP